MHIIGIILAGGSGKRLWPISRRDQPKQYVPFNNKTLIELTLDRIKVICNQKSTYIVTTQEQAIKITQIIGNSSHLIIEPEAKNTAAALLLTILTIYADNPDAVLFFLPADHYIDNNTAFSETIMQAIQYADNNNKLVLIGIKPTYAATEYGYIEYAQTEDVIYKIKKFYEKPDIIHAQKFIGYENFLWNAGIFCGKAKVFLEEFEKHAPIFVKQMHAYLDKKLDYIAMQDISFDKLILEKSENCAVIPAFFSWSDVGSIEHFIGAQNYNKQNKIVEINAHNNLVSQVKKIVVLSGVDNLCIVETPDVLFVSSREQTKQITKITEYLKNNGYEEYL
jgi:mannose-1-phosphate guanylyltransferase